MKTIHEAVKAFLFHCRFEKKLSPKTLKAYEQDCRQFCVFIVSRQLPEALHVIDKQTIKAFLQHLESMKPKTLRRKIATLKAMFNFLEFEDEITVNPFRKMKIQIKEPRMLPKVMTLDEVSRILTYARKHENKPKNEKSALQLREHVRNIALLELLFATGMRVSEVCNVKQTDIDLNAGHVRIMGKGSRQRIVQICHQEVIRTLEQHARNYKNAMRKSGYFFTNRRKTKLSEQSVRNMITRYTTNAGINRHITPHTFRHSFATLLLEQDVDIKYIQQFLGHSSISTTQIYTHVNANKQREIMQTRHPRLGIVV